ncbi:MAG: poly(R)-hydroxyalkanoic acid synthase subunit PhaE [Desulfobacterales bacterium]|jgi:class III poly(R)-hydroxyalkanoic acid synthase PhaE subunit
MNKTKQENTGAETLLATWLKTATDFWGSMARTWATGPDASAASDSTAGSEKQASERVQDSLQNALKTWIALSSVMSDPEALESQLKGVHGLPEVLTKLVQSGWNGYFHLQQQWLQRAERIGKTTEAYKFENLDQNAFALWNDLYEKEFRQFLHLPQLGLTRFYQERVGQAVDEFNIFQAKVAEFLHIFFLPMEKSHKVMQEKLTQMAEAGELPDDSKAYYQMWIKILEGHYMTLFKSSEYVSAMSQTLNALENYKMTTEKVLEDILRMLPVPNQKDMDELYKEIYLLKKKVKTLEKEKERATT